MRGAVICLAAFYGLAGMAGFEACLHAATLPAPRPEAFPLLDAAQGAPRQAEGQGLLAENSDMSSLRERATSLLSNFGKTCGSLERIYDQAQRGDAESQCWLARQYESGSCGLCKDDPLAVVWFKKAAEAGRAEAQFALGMRCFFGLGVPQDLGQAVFLLHKAAQQGHAEAQYRLAGCLEDGLGVNADKAVAVYWYNTSAGLGYPQAQNMLGVLYSKGMGMPRDAYAAANCFLRAAIQGYATAQYNLARSYETGDGLEKNREKAIYWYNKAARQGDADAQARLDAF